MNDPVYRTNVANVEAKSVEQAYGIYAGADVQLMREIGVQRTAGLPGQHNIETASAAGTW